MKHAKPIRKLIFFRLIALSIGMGRTAHTASHSFQTGRGRKPRNGHLG